MSTCVSLVVSSPPHWTLSGQRWNQRSHPPVARPEPPPHLEPSSQREEPLYEWRQRVTMDTARSGEWGEWEEGGSWHPEGRLGVIVGEVEWGG